MKRPDLLARILPARYLRPYPGSVLERLSLGASFAVLSPIKYTKAHPDTEPLGWDGLENIAAQLKIPLYALGGVSADDEQEAIKKRRERVAGNRGYWKA